jgi:predicted transcriptional regulator
MAENTNITLTEENISILNALNQAGDPVNTKTISEITKMEKTLVSKQIKMLKTKGLINSPLRCKYSITDEGKNQI